MSLSKRVFNFLTIRNNKLSVFFTSDEKITKLPITLQTLKLDKIYAQIWQNPEIFRLFLACLTKLKTNQILFNKNSHRFLATPKLSNGWNIPLLTFFKACSSIKGLSLPKGSPISTSLVLIFSDTWHNSKNYALCKT